MAVPKMGSFSPENEKDVTAKVTAAESYVVPDVPVKTYQDRKPTFTVVKGNAIRGYKKPVEQKNLKSPKMETKQTGLFSDQLGGSITFGQQSKNTTLIVLGVTLVASLIVFAFVNRKPKRRRR